MVVTSSMSVKPRLVNGGAGNKNDPVAGLGDRIVQGLTLFLIKRLCLPALNRMTGIAVVFQTSIDYGTYMPVNVEVLALASVNVQVATSPSAAPSDPAVIDIVAGIPSCNRLETSVQFTAVVVDALPASPAA